MTKKYEVRRAIVRALYDYVNAQNLDTIACHDAVIMTESDVAILRREWQNLLNAGYLKAVPGYNGEFCLLSAALRTKMDAGKAMRDDEFLFGPGAIR